MQDIKHAQSLFDLASNNVKALKAMHDAEVFSDEIFGFQAQQAIEKLLKSWLSLAGLSYARTHDLELLIQLLSQAGQKVPLCFANLVDLNDFAVQFRYEVFDDEAIDRPAIAACVVQCLTHLQQLLHAR